MYLDVTQDQHRGLDLSDTVLVSLESYPPDRLAGQLGFEFVGVIYDIANRQLDLKQYRAAEASLQKALAIWLENESYDTSTIKERSAFIYQQLGRVAQVQRAFQQAEQYYQQALQLKIGLNDRYEQAGTYHQLGRVAQEQREFQQAERYYQRALQLKIEFNDRYSQAHTYHQLGMVAQEQQQWQQARDYFLIALKTYVDYDDTYNRGIVLRSLARLWQASGDVHLPTIIVPLLNSTSTEAEEVLRNMLDKKPDEPNNEHLTEG